MATPMSADKFLSILKAEGLKVEERAGWKTNNRNHKGAWGPLNGVMLHHTASGSSGIVDYCYNGSSALPGPLCHAVIEKDGTVVLVGWGRANHAGSGDDDVLSAVIAETYPLPSPNESNTDGNARFIGFECVNKGDGKDPWPAVQVDAMVRASAAICRYYGWNNNSVIRHLDWTNQKIDPKGIDWTKMRADIAARIKAGASSGTKPPAAGPAPAKPVVDLSNLIAAAKRDPSAPQGATSYPKDVKPVEQALDKLNYLAPEWAKDGSFGSKTVDAYQRWQEALGYRGADADGIPGKASLTELGKRTGMFTVKD